MRWIGILTLVVLVAACGDEGRPVPQRADLPIFIPRIDAGTGNCRDDYSVTLEYCFSSTDGGERIYACNAEVLERFEICLGPWHLCREECRLARYEIEDGGVIQDQINECSARCGPQPDGTT